MSVNAVGLVRVPVVVASAVAASKYPVRPDLTFTPGAAVVASVKNLPVVEPGVAGTEPPKTSRMPPLRCTSPVNVSPAVAAAAAATAVTASTIVLWSAVCPAVPGVLVSAGRTIPLMGI